MTNEEKAREISEKLVNNVKDGLYDGLIRKSAMYGAIEMATWKEQKMIVKACNAYCRVCKAKQCKADCECLQDFKKAMKE